MAVSDDWPDLDDNNDVARHWQREHARAHAFGVSARTVWRWEESEARQREQAFAFKQSWLWRFGYVEVE